MSVKPGAVYPDCLWALNINPQTGATPADWPLRGGVSEVEHCYSFPGVCDYVKIASTSFFPLIWAAILLVFTAEYLLCFPRSSEAMNHISLALNSLCILSKIARPCVKQVIALHIFCSPVLHRYWNAADWFPHSKYVRVRKTKNKKRFQLSETFQCDFRLHTCASAQSARGRVRQAPLHSSPSSGWLQQLAAKTNGKRRAADTWRSVWLLVTICHFVTSKWPIGFPI